MNGAPSSTAKKNFWNVSHSKNRKISFAFKKKRKNNIYFLPAHFKVRAKDKNRKREKKSSHQIREVLQNCNMHFSSSSNMLSTTAHFVHSITIVLWPKQNAHFNIVMMQSDILWIPFFSSLFFVSGSKMFLLRSFAIADDSGICLYINGFYFFFFCIFINKTIFAFIVYRNRNDFSFVLFTWTTREVAEHEKHATIVDKRANEIREKKLESEWICVQMHTWLWRFWIKKNEVVK